MYWTCLQCQQFADSFSQKPNKETVYVCAIYRELDWIEPPKAIIIKALTKLWTKTNVVAIPTAIAQKVSANVALTVPVAIKSARAAPKWSRLNTVQANTTPTLEVNKSTRVKLSNATWSTTTLRRKLSEKKCCLEEKRLWLKRSGRETKSKKSTSS